MGRPYNEAEFLLAQLYGLLDSAERCGDCIGPSGAFDGEHLERWETLSERIRKFLKQQVWAVN